MMVGERKVVRFTITSGTYYWQYSQRSDEPAAIEASRAPYSSDMVTLVAAAQLTGVEAVSSQPIAEITKEMVIGKFRDLST